MVVTKQSTWRQRWQKLKENNPLSNSECVLLLNVNHLMPTCSGLQSTYEV